VREDRPLDAEATAILTAVARGLTATACPYFLVGAMGRDLLLVHVFGRPVYRATQDFDFGVAVESWDRFEAATQALIHEGFVEHPMITHRLLFQRRGWEHSIPIDIIPFGGVASPEGVLAWPPKADFIMTVAGFAEALSAAVHVRSRDGLTIPVASLAGLTLLKLFAWRDRQAHNAKDAADLYLIMSNYADAGNIDRLYGGELHHLEATGFDLETAGARLLGRDTSSLCNSSTRAMLAALLADATAMDRLVDQMSHGWVDEAHRLVVLRDLNEFRAGFALA